MHSKVEAHSWRTGKRGEERSIAAQRRKARRGGDVPRRPFESAGCFEYVFSCVLGCLGETHGHECRSVS